MKTECFNKSGFTIVDNAFDNQTVDYLTDELARIDFGETAKQRKSVAFGVRNLLNIVPIVKDFVSSSTVRNLIEPVVGEKAKVVRAIYFDKTPEANWKVPFHQDLTIAVTKQIDVEGFVSWTKKANVLHVQPPVKILENIVSLRVHLDETDETNGALRVVFGSHHFGRLSSEQIEQIKASEEIVNCCISKGGAMLMRPLLLHASSAATNASHRRVLHFEFSSEKLPNGLEWFGS